jgi:flagellar basal body-associated protein FliL
MRAWEFFPIIIIWCVIFMVILVFMGALGGCAQPPLVIPAPTIEVQCLNMTTYTPAQERAFGAAQEALSADNPLNQFITDAIQLRKENRACASALNK